MCIIFFIASDDSSSPYKLILASNRDEIYQRPTKGAHPWTNAEHVIAGENKNNRATQSDEQRTDVRDSIPFQEKIWKTEERGAPGWESVARTV